MRKVHVTVVLSPTQLEALDNLSAKTGKSKSAIVGEALEKFLEVTTNAGAKGGTLG